MNYLLTDFTTLLRNQRHALSLSQRELAGRTRMPQSHYSNVESGKSDPRLSSVIELLRALDLELVPVPRAMLPAVEAVLNAGSGSTQALSTPRPAYSLDDDPHGADGSGDDDDHGDAGDRKAELR